MKKITSGLKKIRKFVDKEYIKYTLLFCVIMGVIYIYLTLGDMGAAPKFTYAEF